MSQTPDSPRERVFIGDVHGCADELEELLGALEYSSDRHELWFVGDLVNRGPKSLAAIRRIRNIADGAVLGNHDLHALARWKGLRGPKPRDTLDELFAAPDADELMEWLSERPAIATWEDLLLVHAGLHPRWERPEEIARRIERERRRHADPFEQPELVFATTVRTCDPEGARPAREGDNGRFEPWDHHYAGARTVVFGHWAQRGRVEEERVRGLDTGCVWGGSLTAWIAERDRFVSVPAGAQYQEVDSPD